MVNKDPRSSLEFSIIHQPHSWLYFFSTRTLFFSLCCTLCLHQGPLLVHSFVFGLRVEMRVRSWSAAGHWLVGVDVFQLTYILVLPGPFWSEPTRLYTQQSTVVYCRHSREAGGGCESQWPVCAVLPIVDHPVRPGSAFTHRVHNYPAVWQLRYRYKPPAGEMLAVSLIKTSLTSTHLLV